MTPHHWVNGPRDVRPIVPAIIRGYLRFWEFRYWIDDPLAIEPLSAQTVYDKCDWVLNGDERSWGVRVGVHFRRVDRIEDCDIVLRFSNGPPPDWPNLMGSGWYYRDSRLDKNVAHVTAQISTFNNTPAFNYILGMELCGHGTFRMWDMYIDSHLPYVGAMGGWVEAMLNGGWPTDAEVADAGKWLAGHAFVDQHPEFTVPGAEA